MVEQDWAPLTLVIVSVSADGSRLQVESGGPEGGCPDVFTAGDAATVVERKRPREGARRWGLAAVYGGVAAPSIGTVGLGRRFRSKMAGDRTRVERSLDDVLDYAAVAVGYRGTMRPAEGERAFLYRAFLTNAVGATG